MRLFPLGSNLFLSPIFICLCHTTCSLLDILMHPPFRSPVVSLAVPPGCAASGALRPFSPGTTPGVHWCSRLHCLLTLHLLFHVCSPPNNPCLWPHLLLCKKTIKMCQLLLFRNQNITENRGDHYHFSLIITPSEAHFRSSCLPSVHKIILPACMKSGLPVDWEPSTDRSSSISSTGCESSDRLMLPINNLFSDITKKKKIWKVFNKSNLEEKTKKKKKKKFHSSHKKKRLNHLHAEHCWPPSADCYWSGLTHRGLSLTGNPSACVCDLPCHPPSCPCRDLQKETGLSFSSRL